MTIPFLVRHKTGRYLKFDKAFYPQDTLRRFTEAYGADKDFVLKDLGRSFTVEIKDGVDEEYLDVLEYFLAIRKV